MKETHFLPLRRRVGLALASLLALAASLAPPACSRPVPLAVIVVLDCSASFWKYREQAGALIQGFVRGLAPGVDRVTLIRLTHEAYVLRPLLGPSARELTDFIDRYSYEQPRDERGTAYGEALTLAASEASRAAAAGYAITVLVVGDGEDEPVAGANKNFDPANPGHWVPDYDRLAKAGAKLRFLYVESRQIQHFGPIVRLFPADPPAWLPPTSLAGRRGVPDLLAQVRR